MEGRGSGLLLGLTACLSDIVLTYVYRLLDTVLVNLLEHYAYSFLEVHM